MEEYSLNQIKRMEQEATKRAREYNSRAKPLPEQSNNAHKFQNKSQNHKKPPENSQNNQKDKNKEPQRKKRGSFSFLNALDIKKLIGENSEQAMLLLLILILSNDNTCDEYLIYALIYIML